ncbi:MCE family protein [Mycolicibacillus parakoreensis]|uniref:MlaD family protein n=1 Tax=Mycolicibacillus parakoreensis TaxID=1069221 RepID=A0ABY3TW48_9MYCO|nr:MlaD family protein [Mycolicibacillus parakoreensis]MCV7315668.1 MCE family protein [Mycolicibacillus parakoreensis]ULN51893.1 MlaD family protein [Mycolicibacillus parakoreensis]
MRPFLDLVDQLCRLVIVIVGWGHQRRILLSVLGLMLTTVVAAAYVTIFGVGINPTQRMITVRVLLNESGGLLANQDVTLRGIPIGRVQAVRLTATGAEAVVAIRADTPIPRDADVRISGLSVAGEQYLDFRPTHQSGPYLTNGSMIGSEQTSVPVSLPQIIDDSRGALAQIDAGKLTAVFGELRVGPDGPRKLSALLDGTVLLTSTLDGVLPETISMLQNTRPSFTLLADVSPGLGETGTDLQNILGGVNAMDGGFRELVDLGSTELDQVDTFIADNRENVYALLGNLTTLSQLLYLRVPALQNLWRPDHDSLVDRLSSTVHDGGIWVIADLYPKYRCDYDLPRQPPSAADFPAPYRYTYCDNDDPSVLVRGARNAPRPPGDDTAGPPPGHDPHETLPPPPVYPPYTLDTPYGGPSLPAWVPN